ncbi:MAG TPA: Ig-like domain-containing protein [Terracidiphilus sp.]|nr:Ig-like domain-containing protein [Terracidiphilus sp.]
MASIRVTAASPSIVVNATDQFVANAIDTNGNTMSGIAFTWASSATGVATINSVGLATGVAAGSAQITASAGGITSGPAALAVTPPVVATIAVLPAAPSIALGATQQFSATAKDSSGNTISGLTFTWASSATSVATIDNSGLATGVAAGTAQITASAGGVTSSPAALTVTPPVVATIAVLPAAPSIALGATEQFSATAKDSSGNTISGLTFTWASSATSVATIDNSGLATGVAAGTAQITASAGGVTSGPAALTVTTSVNGVAAAGSPIAGVAVTLKDSAGHSSTATTGADGAYELNTSGFTPPFLIQVKAPSGNLYSVSADALAVTTINTNPFTDLAIRSWFSSQAVSIDTAFTTPASHAAPAVGNVQILTGAVTDMLQLWLTNAGVDTATFNLISTAFTANGSGLDLVLDESTVNPIAGKVTVTDSATNTTNPTTQSSTITYNTTAGTMTVATTTTNSNGSSESTSTTVVPSQTAQQAALNSILNTMTGMFNAINTNGSQLTAAELTPFLAADLLHDSLNQTQYAAMLATEMRGQTLPAPLIHAVNSIDLVKGTADVVLSMDSSQSAGTQLQNAEFWFESVGGTWLIGGDKRVAMIGSQVSNRNHQGCPMSTCGGSGGSGIAISDNLAVPDGVLSGVTITDASGVTGWNATPIREGDMEVFTYQPTPTTTLDVDLRQFEDGWLDLGSTIIPPGTVFTYALTPVSGPVIDYTWTSNAATTESISILSPNSASLSDYTLGQPQTVTWSLPTTFPIAGAMLRAETYTILPLNMNSSTFQCEIDGRTTASAGAGFPTSGTITIPSTCKGQPVVFVEIEVTVIGIHGEVEQPSLNID